MPFSRNQKGIIQLGILGILVLAGGLFLTSKLASNPDLTFFNIGEYAKGVEKTICETNRGKTLTKCKEKAKKANPPNCKNGLDCTQKNTSTQTPTCSGSCSELPISRATKCQSASNGTQFCCPPNQFARDDIGSCSKAAGFPPKCTTDQCSADSNNGGSLCVNQNHPDGGWFCCNGGKNLVAGKCQ